jgi:hypothetical protein
VGVRCRAFLAAHDPFRRAWLDLCFTYTYVRSAIWLSLFVVTIFFICHPRCNICHLALLSVS